MSKIHSYEDRLNYMKMIEDGYSEYYIHKRYGIDEGLIKWLWRKYEQDGPSALIRKERIKANGALKERVVRDYLEKHIPLLEVSLKYDVCIPTLYKWVRIARNNGIEALYLEKRKHPSKAMGRPKKKRPEEMTELELLRYENERLRAENALLKKVRALVEEREARLRAIGRKPSKN